MKNQMHHAIIVTIKSKFLVTEARVPRLVALVALLYCGLVPGDAQAALYSDRGSLEATSQELTTITFEGLIGTPGYPINYAGVGTFVGTSDGITVSGIKFLGNDYGYGTYIIPGSLHAGATLNGTTTLLMHSGSAIITLPPNISTFGTDFGHSDFLPVGATPFDVTFHLHDGTTETLTLTTAQFFGYAGKVIDSVHFSNRGLSYPNVEYVLLDNVSIGTIPEPASYALLLAGLGALVSVRTRRQAQVKLIGNCT